MTDIFTSLAFAVSRALDHDLPSVKYKRPFHKDGERTLVDAERRPHQGEIDVYHFPQVWGSTALGFGGIGGQAMTSAYTTVVVEGANVAVYFSGRLAYVVVNPNDEFFRHLSSHNMAEVGKSSQYRKEVAA